MAKAEPSAMLELTDDEFHALLHEDFAQFVQAMYREKTSGEELVWDAYLDLICAKLGDVAHGRLRNLIITMPPRHLKSFCVSVALPAFVLGHYPGQEIMCVSYGGELAKEFASGTQRIMESDLYTQVFGPVLKAARQPLHRLKTRQGGVRRATSLDGAATGIGSDLMIFDDPQKPGETLSDTIRRSTNQAYEQTFLSRRNMPATARTIIVMQRLHEDDFVAHVLGLGGDWEILNLPAIAEEDQAIAFSTFLGDHVYRRAEGSALHPRRVPLAELDRIRQASGEAVWASQYQQRPAPAGGGLVKVGWFPRFTDAERPAAFDRVVQSWDTANTIQAWSDYSVCTTWGLVGKHAYLLHVHRERLIYPDLKKAIRSQARQHGAKIVYIEDRASGTQAIQELKHENFGEARAVKPTTDKQTRMVNQTARIENGFVHLPVQAPWLEEYLHELAVFPNGKFDDQVDSTSQALDEMFRNGSADYWLELAEEWERKKKAQGAGG